MNRFLYPALLAMSVMALDARAQAMKPGLWEMTSKMQSGSGEMEKAMAEAQKQMAAMPPEQRKMMQDMMAKQGASMGTNSAGAMAIKLCMTQEMISSNDFVPQEGDCKTTNSPRAGNTMKVSFVCTKPPSSGEGQITFNGPEAYTSKMTVNTTSGGKSEKMTMEGQGNWVSSECGAIKPMAPGKK